MPLRKRSLRFFLVFVATFVVLLGAWGVLASSYGALFRAAGGAMALGSGPWAVKYSRQLDKNASHDTQVLLLNRQDSLKRTVDLSSRRMAYMPTALLIALTLATPVPWVRKGVSLLWGFIGVNVYIAIRLALVPSTYIVAPGEESRETVLAALEWILSGSSAGWTIVPLVIWVVVTLTCGLPLTSPISPKTAPANNPT